MSHNIKTTTGVTALFAINLTPRVSTCHNRMKWELSIWPVWLAGRVSQPAAYLAQSASDAILSDLRVSLWPTTTSWQRHWYFLLPRRPMPLKTSSWSKQAWPETNWTRVCGSLGRTRQNRNSPKAHVVGLRLCPLFLLSYFFVFFFFLPTDFVRVYLPDALNSLPSPVVPFIFHS